MSSDDEKLITQIEKIIDETMESHVAILGISIGTEIATKIYSKFKPEIKSFSDIELIASSTSFHYISNSLFRNIAKNNLNSSYVTVDDFILLMNITKEISSAMILDRSLAELEGISAYDQVLNEITLKINALVETVDYVSQDPLVKIIRAVPSALFLAIIGKEGLPIKIIDDGTIQAPMVSSQIAALSNLTQVMLKKQMDYTILQGPGAVILVIQFDEERILAISIPEQEKENVGQYLARIKEIIRNSDTSSFNIT
ncbi:MAG: hypothetical protein DRO88_06125 [Promethearchaeia archaeon]|nr:MAG: hypothetical protein DRO88_06125 [Candidatus Lokiarchaeia archaeon]